MARTPTTPGQASAKAREHAAVAAAALRTLRDASADASEFLEAAKALEAAGCYIRRATEKGLLP